MAGGGIVDDVMCVSPEVLQQTQPRGHPAVSVCNQNHNRANVPKISDYTTHYTINSVRKQFRIPCVEGCELLVFNPT